MLDKTVEDNIRSKSSVDLFLIVNHYSEDYSNEAVILAKEEYDKRDCSESQKMQHAQRMEKLKKEEAELANVSASPIEKAIYFLFPGVLMILFASEYEQKGLTKKYNQLKKCSKYGILFYVALITIALVSSSF